MFYTYILRSTKSGRYYIGHTNNIDARLERHNTGKVTATKNKGPWVIMSYEVFDTKPEANSREFYVKSMKSSVFTEKLIEGFKTAKSLILWLRFKTHFLQNNHFAIGGPCMGLYIFLLLR